MRLHGWIIKDLYLEWFQFFLQNIPPNRPVLLLLQDGHASHISIKLSRPVRMMYTYYVFQPTPPKFYSHWMLVCSRHSKLTFPRHTKHPGRVITSHVIAALVIEAWPLSLTPLNVMGAFKKCGIYPINPGEVSDQRLAPAKAVQQQSGETKQSEASPGVSLAGSGSHLFTPEVLYEQKYKGYDKPTICT